MLFNESILTFAEAAKKLPTVNGRKVHTSTLWRWARYGCQGVKLEVRRLGGRFVTSVEALERFSIALADIDLPERPSAQPKPPTDTQRAKSIAQAESQLKAAGVLR